MSPRKQQAREQAHEAKESGKQLARDLNEKVSSAAVNAKESALSLQQQAQDKAHDKLDQAKDKLDQVQERAVDSYNEAKQQTQAFFSLDTFAGEEYSVRRAVTAYSLAFIASTIVRVVCISPRFPIFGQHLQKTLAPIENDDVSWNVIALTRIIDLLLGVYVWAGAGKVDGPLVGFVLSMISRPSLSQFFHHHFLLSTKTVTEVLLTDIVASAAALKVISSFLPRQPSFRPAPISWLRRHLNQNDLQTIFLSLSLGALSNGLLHFLADRFYLHAVMKAGVVDHLVPAYFAKVRPSTAFMLKNPLLSIPTLRSDFRPLNMAESITYGVPTISAIFVLSLFILPHKSIGHVTTLTYLLCAPATFLTIWNLLPVTAWASAVVSLSIGLRQALVAAIMSWVLTDLRRPVSNRVFVAHSQRVVGSEIDGSKLLQDEVTTI